MDGQTVIVTGASRGLGAAVARLAARLGANLVLAARSLEQLKDEARKIESTGGRALVVRGDVSREEDCREIVRSAVDRFGRIDALVNNGGIIEPIGYIADANSQEWEQNWAVNVLGPVMLTRMALSHLRQTNGRIVNITSGASENVITGWGAYSAAKAAIDHLTRILSAEEPAITALALWPGLLETDMQSTIREKGKGRMAERNYNWLVRQHEQGQLLQPEIPAQAIACLALYAPHEWSGERIAWDDPRLQRLVQNL